MKWVYQNIKKNIEKKIIIKSPFQVLKKEEIHCIIEKLATILLKKVGQNATQKVLLESGAHRCLQAP
jgi:hypothetical protein